MHDARYEIIVRGPLPESVLNEVREAHATLEMRTVLIGQVRDQAELQALLRRIHGMGLELLELHRVPTAAQHDRESPVVDAGPPAASGEAR